MKQSKIEFVRLFISSGSELDLNSDKVDLSKVVGHSREVDR